MFKYVLSAFICLAFAMPAAAQCGCDCAPPTCQSPKKKLAFVPRTVRLPQISRKCVTDACGCSRRKLSLDCVEVNTTRLGLVERDPCDVGCFQRMRDGLKGLGGGCGCRNKAPACGCEAPAPCGCEAPVPCGCEEPAPAPCGCDMGYDAGPESIMYSDPVSAPMAPMAPMAADCGCNG